MNSSTTVVDPWQLNVPGYTTDAIDGFGTVDDYGTLHYWPAAMWWVFYAQSHDAPTEVMS